MVTKRDTSNAGIYDRLDSLRLEVKQDINAAVTAVSISQGRLEKKFDDLEAGRLTRAEGHISDLRLEMQVLDGQLNNQKTTEKTLSNKFLALGAIGMLILSGFIYGFFQWIFTKVTK